MLLGRKDRKKCLYNIERGTKAGREKNYANRIKDEVDMTTGKRCCDILAQERAKRARKEEKKSVQCLLCTMYSGVLKKKFSDLSAQEGTKGA